MLRGTTALLGLRPRFVQYKPPPLSRRKGSFECHVCEHSWDSPDVWVTKLTHKCYQGQSCAECGTTVKPFFVTRLEDSIFDTRRTPHVVGKGKSGGRGDKKKSHYSFVSHTRLRNMGRR